jgi:hypothetical protein
MPSLRMLRTIAITMLVIAEVLLLALPFLVQHWPAARGWLATVQPGSWPDWVVAGATLLAVIFAARAANAAIQTNKDQAEQIRACPADLESWMR